MTKLSTILGLILLCVGPQLACSDLSCGEDADCYSGEVCESGECQAASANNGNNGNTGNNGNNGNNGNVSNNGTISNNGTGNNGTGNNGTAGNNGTSGNNGTNNNGSNNGSNNSTNNTTDRCVADLFTVSCETDGNDQFADYFNRSNTGCTSGDDLVTMNETKRMILCGLETQDLIRQSYVGCDTLTFVMEVTFDPVDEMCADLAIFEFGVDGKSCDEPTDEIECVIQPDGGVIATALVRPSNSVNSAFINIKKVQPDVHFEYDLTVVVR